MQIIKAIDFSTKEVDSLNTMLIIWGNFYGRCKGENESYCENCVLLGFCRNTNSLISDGLQTIKNNLTDRI